MKASGLIFKKKVDEYKWNLLDKACLHPKYTPSALR